MEMKNPVDAFGWMVESIRDSKDKRLTVTIVGIPNTKSYCVNECDLERCINNRMNNKEGEKENMSDCFEKEYEKFFNRVRASNRIAYNTMCGTNPNPPRMAIRYMNAIPEIKDVVFNPPATIVFWTDGTKTVVKCQNNEEFDPEKGLTMAFFKKTHGNKGHYFEEIKKWCHKGSLSMIKDEMHEMTDEKVIETVEKGSSNPNPKWHIWYRTGFAGPIHLYDKDYSSKSSAVRRARKLFTNASEYISWVVSQKAPFGPEGDYIEWNHN